MFEPADPSETLDLICIGFGPASLAIAVALHDRVQRNRLERPPRVLFIERQPKFQWHSGMLLEGSHMQISFLKDLATLRDPTSHFTFVNYLHKKGRLISFSNLGTFTPSRIEYAQYMSWCAEHFTDNVRYGHAVEEVRPVSSAQLVDSFEVSARGAEGIVKYTSKNVVVALGGRPSIPRSVPNHPRVLHSSQYRCRVEETLPDRNKEYSIAVLGGGQSAAEIFRDLHSRYPNAKTTLIIRDSALRPSDDSPFVNEVFDPSRVDTTYKLPPHIRRQMISKDKATNYSVVRLDVLEELYSFLYSQTVLCPNPEEWKHRILTLREIASVETLSDGKSPRLRLQLASVLRHANGYANGHGVVNGDGYTNGHVNGNGHAYSSSDSSEPPSPAEIEDTTELEVDALFVATGYNHDCHEKLLQPCQTLRKEHHQSWKVHRDYSIDLDRSRVDPSAGIWLQGCNEATHGLSDTLLSILSIRGDEIVNSIFPSKA